MFFKSFSSLAALALAAGVLPAGSALAADIDLQLKDRLAAYGKAEVFVKMDSEAALDAAESVTDRVARIEMVRNALIAHADRTQAKLRRLLEARGVEYRSFWIDNTLFIPEADARLVAAIAKMDDVAAIAGNDRIFLDPIVAADDSVDAIEWGVSKIDAPAVWDMGITGSGIVVANIDTGVRYTHDALVNQYRGNLGGGAFDHDYNWWDPAGICAGGAPCDNNNHGSHTMGTIVGGDGRGSFSNDIGVAPGASWIAAKGCESSSCSRFALTSSAEWILCPTRVDGSDADCSKAPHVVNNSWGGGGGDTWYWSYVRSWIAAGIIPVFSAGNSGPSCSTTGSPGDYYLVTSVGATDSGDRLASFSSKGPGAVGKLKPTIVAPGVSVRSAVRNSDSSYGSLSGTSMAAPHVTGAVALMLEANPAATRRDITGALVSTTSQMLPAPPSPTSCGGRAYDEYPNYIYGFGRINAFDAVTAITAP